MRPPAPWSEKRSFSTAVIPQAPAPSVRYAWDFGDGTGAREPNGSHVYDKAGRYVVTLTVTDQNGLSDASSARIQVSEPEPTPAEPPTATIQASAEAQVGEGVTFDGSQSQSSNPIVNYAWDFGDRTQGNGAVVEHVYAQSGVYNVTLTVTDNAGQMDATTTQITINDLPQTPPTAIIAGPATASVGEDVTFSAEESQPGSSEIVNYAWDFGNGDTQDGSRNMTASTRYDAPGQYPVSLTVTDANDLSNTATAEIVVNSTLEGTTWSLGQVLAETEITLELKRGTGERLQWLQYLLRQLYRGYWQRQRFDLGFRFSHYPSGLRGRGDGPGKRVPGFSARGDKLLYRWRHADAFFAQRPPHLQRSGGTIVLNQAQNDGSVILNEVKNLQATRRDSSTYDLRVSLGMTLHRKWGLPD